MFVLVDELSGIFANMSKPGRSQERTMFIEGWRGDGRFKTDRMMREEVYTEHACISVFGTTQPSKLQSLMEDGLRAKGGNDDGFCQRFQIAVFPEPLPGPKLIDERGDRAAQDKLATIYERFFTLPAQAIEMHLDDAAWARFQQWWHWLHSVAVLDCSDALQSHLYKYDGLVAKLAALNRLFAAVESGENLQGSMYVTLQQMEKAIRLAEGLMRHARKIYAEAGDDFAAAKELLKHVVNGELAEPFRSEHVIQAHWSKLKRADVVSKALDQLVRHGYLFAQRTKQKHARTETTLYFTNPSLKHV
jgi:hypothetical protein